MHTFIGATCQGCGETANIPFLWAHWECSCGYDNKSSDTGYWDLHASPDLGPGRIAILVALIYARTGDAPSPERRDLIHKCAESIYTELAILVVDGPKAVVGGALASPSQNPAWRAMEEGFSSAQVTEADNTAALRDPTVTNFEYADECLMRSKAFVRMVLVPNANRAVIDHIRAECSSWIVIVYSVGSSFFVLVPTNDTLSAEDLLPAVKEALDQVDWIHNGTLIHGNVPPRAAEFWGGIDASLCVLAMAVGNRVSALYKQAGGET